MTTGLRTSGGRRSESYSTWRTHYSRWLECKTRPRRSGHISMRVDQWNIHPEHFWLRGTRPEKIVHYNETLRMWNVYGYPESVDILTSPAIFSNNAGRLDPVEIDEEIMA